MLCTVELKLWFCFKAEALNHILNATAFPRVKVAAIAKSSDSCKRLARPGSAFRLNNANVQSGAESYVIDRSSPGTEGQVVRAYVVS